MGTFKPESLALKLAPPSYEDSASFLVKLSHFARNCVRIERRVAGQSKKLADREVIAKVSPFERTPPTRPSTYRLHAPRGV